MNSLVGYLFRSTLGVALSNLVAEPNAPTPLKHFEGPSYLPGLRQNRLNKGTHANAHQLGGADF